MIGDAGVLEMPKVAIVGTRAPTQYGIRIARALATQMADAGICVVSGMARGIDSAAHWGSLEAAGKTIGVLGTSVDVPYPSSNRPLYNRLAEEGLLLSEFADGRPAFKGCFPRRNRIIAGLSKVTIVVEAGLKSGALNTASHALELGRTVAAIPGNIDCPQAAGSNQLLRDGAHLIASIADAMMLIGADPKPRASMVKLSDMEEMVYAALGSDGKDIDSIAALTRLPVRECMQAVGSLEVLGLVECLLTGEIVRR
jgi:DNA processing protein